MAEVDVRRSLTQLWAEAGEDLEMAAEEVPEHLLTKPLRRLSAAELTHLIEHQVGLQYLVPLAVEKLEGEPLLQAQHYPGDLLVALMEARTAFWVERHDLWLEVIGLLEQAVTRINESAEKGELGEYMPAYVGDNFMGALLHFRGIHEE